MRDADFITDAFLCIAMTESAGHLMPRWFGVTTTSPSTCASRRSRPLQGTRPSLHSTEQSAGIQLATSPSSMFLGAQSVLFTMTSLRMAIGPQISWLIMYLILARNSFMAMTYRVRYSAPPSQSSEHFDQADPSTSNKPHDPLN